ncbi:anti-sigma factor RsbA family regulatory protein [Streptomyces sp. NPDC016845]|uniref:anti-sigma factor RsbA family regulatory protein n=1 Tax=Streptomyces sp. NPDC016845 TaxID=3364972 RepID=UPI0037928ADD
MSTVPAPSVPSAPPPLDLDHPALFYRDEEEYLAGTAAFVREGLAVGDPVAVAVPAANLALIRAELGEEAGRVRLLDMERAGRNPGRIIPRVLRAFADSHPGRRPRIIGEPIWAGRTTAEYPACAQHEALVNLAFEGRGVTILCPYDATRLTAPVLSDAHVTHPAVIRSGARTPSAQYAPQALVARYNEPLHAPPGVAATAYTKATLTAVRQYATRWAAGLGLAEPRLDDFELAVAELTTNSVVHGGGEGLLGVWAEDRHVVCQVRDAGVLDDPLAGRRLPARDQRGGRGLLLVNVVADLVRTHSTPEDGTTTHVYFRL